MKVSVGHRVWDIIRRNAKEHLILIAVCAVFFAFYRNLSGETTATIILCVMVVWVIIMVLCSLGTAKILQHERNYTLTKKRAVGYSFLVASPIYAAWALLSLMPIVQYEGWLLTGLPICIFSFVSLIPLSGKWKEMRTCFWLTQSAIYLVLMISGQAIVHDLVI